MKPRIFLGSSGRHEKLLQALTRGLHDIADVEQPAPRARPMRHGSSRRSSTELGMCISRAGYEVFATELAMIYQEASKLDVDATLYAEGPARASSELMRRKQGSV